MKATAIAGSNIALIKYWGNRDEALRLPMNNSISITLDNAYTTTTVEFDARLKAEEVVINGQPMSGAEKNRVTRFLDALRVRLGFADYARVQSENNFPMASGIASSASAFAALAKATVGARGLDLTPAQISGLARLGSGSAARSVLGGFVEWQTGSGDADSVAVELAPPAHWHICDVIAIVATGEKKVKSTEGHTTAHSSPLYPARLAHVATTLEPLRRSIANRDFATLGDIAELDALSMHAVMMTATPSLLYWTPATTRLLHSIREWRAEGLPAYFTLDAGPNVHILTLPAEVETLRARLKAIPEVERVLVCNPGEGTRLVETHLF